MILIDNINVLKEIDPSIWENIKKYENEESRNLFTLEETKKGNNTLILNKDGKKTYLHSKYDPIREVNTVVETYGSIDENSNIIFYGTGLGYHIKLILEKYPNINYYIYEPVPELIYNFLSNINLRSFYKERLKGISLGETSNLDKLARFIDLYKDNLKIIELPSHKQNFTEEFDNFNDMLVKLIKDKRIALATEYKFQERWVKNSMKNLKEVLSTPNILVEKKGMFKNKPAILVAAGPSLNDEIENLRYIKEKGLAYIFSVGSAINTLIHNDIYPDAATTYDPSERNQIVFKLSKEKGIKDIPMIFGSSVGYETIEGYLGKKYHMVTSQDTVSNYFLRGQDRENINIVQDAPTIAVVTLQLLYELGFDRIILVGQNLGYRGKEQYSEGISYNERLSENEIKKATKIKDVYGNEILTNEGFNSMRLQMEHYIKNLPNIEVINTTKGGANIVGTEFIDLNQVIKTKLKEKQVEDNWLDSKITGYNMEYTEDQLRAMDRSYDKVLKINKSYNEILGKIEKAIKNRNYAQAEKLYIKLDNELNRIEKNDFYKVFILPMNRVHYKILADSIDSLNEMKNPYEKGKKIVENFRRFIDICTDEIEIIKPLYEEMKEVILNHIKTSSREGE